MSAFSGASRKLALPDAKKRRVYGQKQARVANSNGDDDNDDGGAESSNDFDGTADLDELQRYAVRCVIDQRKNVFLTGQAGTGKSFVIGEILRRAAALGTAIALTATTGLAAANLERIAPPHVTPQTIHRWAGIGLGQEPVALLVRKIRENKYTLERWKADRLLLVIDEVSMLPPTLLRKLDEIARALRGQPKIPFGGIQVLFVGDFYQLPPVIKDGNGEEHDCDKRTGLQYEYCFETQTWIDAIDCEVVLQRIFRQADERFIGVLREVRDGRLSEQSLALLKQRSFESLFYELVSLQKQVLQVLREKETTNDDETTEQAVDLQTLNSEVQTAVLRSLLAKAGMEIPSHLRVLLGAVEPTKLMTVNRIVDEENRRRIEELDGCSFLYESHFDHNVRVVDKKDDTRVEMIEKEMKTAVTAAEFLDLKVGAQVMLLANLDSALVNGRRGYVVDFVPDDLFVKEESKNKKDDEEDEESDRPFVDNDPRYSKAIVDNHRPGERLMGLSSKSKAAGGSGKDGKKKKKKASDAEPHAVSAVGLAATNSEGVVCWPVVEFDNGRTQTIKPYRWQRKNKQFKWKASITQVPLKAAYAMSIHKSQSQTLSSVVIDLTAVFASGQTYVALSRATSLDGLVLENFDESFFTAQPPNIKVVQYYRTLMAAQEKELAAAAKKK